MSKLLYIVLFGVSVVQGCAKFVVQNPSEAQLAGKWVSIGVVPYAKLEYSPNGESLLILVADDREYSLYRVEEFRPQKNGFTIRVSDTLGQEESELLSGVLVGDQLSLGDGESNEYALCFVRAERASMLGKIADEAVLSYRQSEHNN